HSPGRQWTAWSHYVRAPSQVVGKPSFGRKKKKPEPQGSGFFFMRFERARLQPCHTAPISRRIYPEWSVLAFPPRLPGRRGRAAEEPAPSGAEGTYPRS